MVTVMLMAATATAAAAALVLAESDIFQAHAVLEVDSIGRTRMLFSLQDSVLSVV